MIKILSKYINQINTLQMKNYWNRNKKEINDFLENHLKMDLINIY